MRSYADYSREELLQEQRELAQQYADFKARGIKLDMSRGKPSAAQLDLGNELLKAVTGDADYHAQNGTDCRNYGVLDGLPEAKELMASMMDVPASQTIIYGGSSLNIMYDTVSRAMTNGVLGSTPWAKLDKVTFLCPVPGYDRHFSICEHFGIDMIPVAMDENGPDMDEVERLVASDASIKGIWCVPKYSNPTGISYSDEVVRRFARLAPTATDFRIYWDNAYAVHHLYADDQDMILDILEECVHADNPDMVYQFASTSKVSFAGAGISALSSSEANIAEAKKQLSFATIGFDKLNQLRHARYFVDAQGIAAHMEKHAALLAPKFEAVLETLTTALEGRGLGTWIKPKGGYFITFEANEGCATDILARAKEAGLVMTPAGAPYPYGDDPKDSVIRIAPSFPTPEELKTATELFVLCVKLVAVEKALG